MTIKISELPVLNASGLITSTAATFPVAAGVSSLVTYQTSIGAIKDYVENGNYTQDGTMTASGGLQNTPIGNATPSTALFTTMGASGNATVNGLTVNTSGIFTTTIQALGGIQATPIGNVSPSTALFTTAGASGNITASALTVNTSGVFTTTLQAAGGLQNTPIGNVTPSTALFTTAGASGNVTASALTVNNSATVGGTLGVTGNINGTSLTLSGSSKITGSLDADGGLQSTPIGNAAASTGQFTTVSATGNITASGLTVNTSAVVTTTVQALGGLQATPIGNATPSTANITSLTVTTTSYFNGNVNTNNIMPFGNANANIGSTALQFNTVFAKATQAQYADLAEKYEADYPYQPGVVLVFGGEKEVTTTALWGDTRVAGVVSTDPAYLMNSESTGVAVALRGKVPVQIVGQVTKGDLLVTSDEPGYAISVGFRSDYNPAAVVAKSLVTDRNYEKRVIWAVVI